MPECTAAALFFSEVSVGGQLIVSPLRKLTPKVNARLDDIGTVDGIIESLGPYITGAHFCNALRNRCLTVL